MTMPDTPILKTEKLSKKYGERWAVSELDLEIPRGQVYGFLGANGAGKTTSIRMMLGLITPTSGRATINGLDVHADPLRALSHVGAMVEAPAFYGYLTGRENLHILGRIAGGVDNKRVDKVLDMVGLLERGDDKVKGYSQGMRQRLGLGQALLSNPAVIILDEPTNGLDPSGMLEVRHLIRDLAANEGITIFISSHLLNEVQAICGRVAIINEGKLVAEGLVEQLLKRELIRLDVKVSDKTRAINVLREYGPKPAPGGYGDITIQIEGDRVPEVNRLLVEAGVDVFALVPREESLEKYFLELTGYASGDRGNS
jgi:ABC-2 type transport system ATP-binding protein